MSGVFTFLASKTGSSCRWNLTLRTSSDFLLMMATPLVRRSAMTLTNPDAGSIDSDLSRIRSEKPANWRCSLLLSDTPFFSNCSMLTMLTSIRALRSLCTAGFFLPSSLWSISVTRADPNAGLPNRPLTKCRTFTRTRSICSLGLSLGCLPLLSTALLSSRGICKKVLEMVKTF